MARPSSPLSDSPDGLPKGKAKAAASAPKWKAKAAAFAPQDAAASAPQDAAASAPLDAAASAPKGKASAPKRKAKAKAKAAASAPNGESEAPSGSILGHPGSNIMGSGVLSTHWGTPVYIEKSFTYIYIYTGMHLSFLILGYPDIL